MSTCRLYGDSVLRPILRRELSKEEYNKISALLKDAPKIDAIPEQYIINYMKKHDPVCQLNLTNLIQNYHFDTGGDDGYSGV